MNRSKLLHSGAVLIAGILWGTMGIFVRKFNAAGLSAMEIVASRVIGTTLIYLIFLPIFQRDAMKMKWKDLWCFVGTGICSIVFFNYCYSKTILLADLSVAAVLLYTAPSIVIVLSAILFKEQFTKWKVIAVVMAFVGCVLVTGMLGGAVQMQAGALITGLGAGFGYALYTIFSRFALDKGYSSLTITFYTFLVAILGVLPFVHVSEIWGKLQQVEGGLGFFLAFVFFTTVLTYLLYTWGMQEIENGIAAILATIEPVVATLIGVLVFREKMSALEMLGIVLVVVSVALCNRE